ncbi:MAG: hypothetical protein EOS30_29245 [Mesorhizobium sp.]|nr:hypothetical protein EN746_05515 [Mesorhizobium sp. M8A.F.Ca.ET.023.02.2.1]RWC67033.1 MAG: hypothetical protein EOS30_29245 [Mesorhizobium sp.]
MINPVFVSYPEEARLLGELVLGYGELDISFALTAGVATRNKFVLLHAVNQVRSETSRLDLAHALSVGAFTELGLADEYARIHKAIRFCLKVRNQWAHSQYGHGPEKGLAFTRTDGDVFAAPVKPTVWNCIKLELLQKQEAYFEYCRRCILTVESNLVPILVGKPAQLQMPPEMHEPHMQSQWSRAVPSRKGRGQQPQH